LCGKAGTTQRSKQEPYRYAGVGVGFGFHCDSATVNPFASLRGLRDDKTIAVAPFADRENPKPTPTPAGETQRRRQCFALSNLGHYVAHRKELSMNVRKLKELSQRIKQLADAEWEADNEMATRIMLIETWQNIDASLIRLTEAVEELAK
jgi:hypothetical protein